MKGKGSGKGSFYLRIILLTALLITMLATLALAGCSFGFQGGDAAGASAGSTSQEVGMTGGPAPNASGGMGAGSHPEPSWDAGQEDEGGQDTGQKDEDGQETVQDLPQDLPTFSPEVPEEILRALPRTGIPEGFDRDAVPAFSTFAWADVNGDIPFFTETEMEAAEQAVEAGAVYQAYGELDGSGRCTGACALVGTQTLPVGGREAIGMIKPTGWHTVKYDGIDGNYLYNRCHLIGFQLTGQNANERNLITGTRFMNVEGMLPYEDSVLAYVQGTGKHVLYRVTPYFEGQNLVADGVLMEARSVEDPLVQFCAFCYNLQPGVTIDYATGESEGAAFTGTKGSDAAPAAQDGKQEDPAAAEVESWDFIVNVNTGKFHLPSCSSVGKMRPRNRQGFHGTKEELIRMGYTPCGSCRP